MKEIKNSLINTLKCNFLFIQFVQNKFGFRFLFKACEKVVTFLIVSSEKDALNIVLSSSGQLILIHKYHQF